MSVFTKTKNSKTRLVAAVILTLLAGASVYFYLMSIRQTVPVVVAARDIGPNTVITEKDIWSANISADSKHRLAISNPEQVIGSMTKETVYKDMQLITSHLAGKDSNSLKPGETLLPLSNTIASPGLKTGNIVSIIVTRPEGAFNLGNARIYQIKGDILRNEKGGVNIQGKEAVLVVNESEVQSILGAIANAKSVYLLVAQGG